MILSTLITLMLGSLTVYAEDYKYIPPEAPENWREMSHTERWNYILSCLGGENSEKYNEYVKDSNIQNMNIALTTNLFRFRNNEGAILNSPNVIDNKNFLEWFKYKLEDSNYSAWQALVAYIMFYDYDYFYEVCEGVRSSKISDFYESFPITNPEYTPPETLKTREEILSILAPAEPEPDPATVSDPDSVSDTDILLEPMSEDNPIPVISIVVAGTLVGLGVFAFFLKGS